MTETGVRSNLTTSMRPHVVALRNRLVLWLNRDPRSPTIRRNAQDDKNLQLLLRFTLNDDSNCLDIGANRGLFLQEFVHLAPHGHHIAYEPIPHFAEELRSMFPTVDVRNRALSDEDGTAVFTHVDMKGCEAYSGLASNLVVEKIPAEGKLHLKQLDVPVERLDSSVREGWLPDFVKIDVEGAELEVLQGARETLLKARPTVAFEHDRYSSATDQIYELLCEQVGLRIFNMDGQGPLDFDTFRRQVGARWNWVARR